ncbi:Fatty acid cis/trans isomerase [Cycloclasticus zancles 78-ME]|uniref:Fatty acid cis/trans isomerase n=2 Tax=Cycloclasticus zancles TaxID=1329899 RepID=S5TXA4_9GAMM|nr:Fatty acid cis/trans isomerase [Cycloclasticus zancles 78-ME]
MVFVFLLSIVVVYSLSELPDSQESEFVTVDMELSLAQLDAPMVLAEQVRPILDRRCVVCHGCFDAPCQLKLSSIEGMHRGASEERIYEPKRITEMQPTRLLVDAKSTAEWRSRGFFSIRNEGDQSPKNNLKNSVLYHLLRLKQENPQPRAGLLPDSISLGLDRKQTCPTLGEISDYARDHPMWGMPYAMPNLSALEYRTLVSWLAQDMPTVALPGPSAAVLPQIEQWESFLNQSSRKQRLVSRYLYEHLFHAHIHFSESPTREFYRLVRSTTPSGETVDEIPTVLPHDDPGDTPFYYRLLRYHPTIVAKNHIVYEFSEGRMQRYRELFLANDYEVDQLPSYETEISSNPFKVFAAIPATSRYRFLLDDAHFFIEGFIKGPACRGQIALDVIEDQFWVMFFDPNQPIITNNTQFIGTMADELQIPADGGSNLDFLRIWTDYWKGQRSYMESKQAWFRTIGTHDLDHAMDFIWDGDGNNPNAALTVFRHFDSGSVAYGLVGGNPETAWVIDYPLLERIHYLLVANFNVFGNMGHRMSTRIYMDFLRMEGEDYFLAFLPVNRRKEVRDAWYVGQRSSIQKLFSAPQEWLSTESISGYLTADPQQELYQSIKGRLASMAYQAEAMNQCGSINCENLSSQKAEKRADRAMQQIAQLQGTNLHAFSDVAFVRVRMDSPEQDLVYTLVRNKAYKNVTSFLADGHERDRSDIDRDTMTVVKWQEGSYPNFFFSVALSELDDFAKNCAAIRDRGDYEKFIDQYGVRRTNPEFWEMADWFQDEYKRNKPILSGLFDLNRYENR